MPAAFAAGPGMPQTGPEATNAFLGSIAGPAGDVARLAAVRLRELLPGAIETCEGGDVGFGVAPGYKGLVFTLTPHAETGHVTLSIADGASLKDPTGVLEGKGAKHRHVKLASAADLDRPALDRLLREAAKRRQR